LKERNRSKKKPKPILLKIAPDLTDKQLDDIIEIVEEVGLAGVIATNTTISREGLSMEKLKIDEIGDGGLSGVPVRNRSTQVIKYLKGHAKKPFPIVGVGGINSSDDAIEKLEAGASLIQIYTGFIYQGPGLIKRINKAILKNK
jgi:dihydroorotate dehydrogenase